MAFTVPQQLSLLPDRPALHSAWLTAMRIALGKSRGLAVFTQHRRASGPLLWVLSQKTANFCSFSNVTNVSRVSQHSVANEDGVCPCAAHVSHSQIDARAIQEVFTLQSWEKKNPCPLFFIGNPLLVVLFLKYMGGLS